MAELTLKEYQEKLDGLLDSESYDAVIHHCRHILQQYPKNAAIYRVLGRALFQQSRWEEAAEVFRRLLGAYPSDLTAHTCMSYIAERMKQPDAAIWHMERAFDQNPNDEGVLRRLRELYLHHRSVELTRIQLTTGAVARQYIRSGRYAAAVETLHDTLGRMPDRDDLRVLLMQALWLDGRRVDAAETALNILQRYPYSPEANRILSELWLDEQRPSDAQRFLTRVEQVEPYLALKLVGGADTDDPFLLEELDYGVIAQRQLSTTDPDWLGALSEEEAAALTEAPPRKVTDDLPDLLPAALPHTDDLLDSLADEAGEFELDFDFDEAEAGPAPDDFLSELAEEDGDAFDELEAFDISSLGLEVTDDAGQPGERISTGLTGLLTQLDEEEGDDSWLKEVQTGELDDLFGVLDSEDEEGAAEQGMDEFIESVAGDDSGRPPGRASTGLTGLLAGEEEDEAEALPADPMESDWLEEFAPAQPPRASTGLTGLLGGDDEDALADDIELSEEDIMAEIPDPPLPGTDEMPDLFGDLEDERPAATPASDELDPLAWAKQSDVEIVEGEVRRSRTGAIYEEEDSGDFVLQGPAQQDRMAWLKASGVEVEDDEAIDDLFAEMADEEEAAAAIDPTDPAAWLKEAGIELEEDEEETPAPAEDEVSWLTDDSLLEEAMDYEEALGTWEGPAASDEESAGLAEGEPEWLEDEELAEEAEEYREGLQTWEDESPGDDMLPVLDEEEEETEPSAAAGFFEEDEAAEPAMTYGDEDEEDEFEPPTGAPDFFTDDEDEAAEPAMTYGDEDEEDEFEPPTGAPDFFTDDEDEAAEPAMAYGDEDEEDETDAMPDFFAEMEEEEAETADQPGGLLAMLDQSGDGPEWDEDEEGEMVTGEPEWMGDVDELAEGAGDATIPERPLDIIQKWAEEAPQTGDTYQEEPPVSDQYDWLPDDEETEGEEPAGGQWFAGDDEEEEEEAGESWLAELEGDEEEEAPAAADIPDWLTAASAELETGDDDDEDEAAEAHDDFSWMAETDLTPVEEAKPPSWLKRAGALPADEYADTGEEQEDDVGFDWSEELAEDEEAAVALEAEIPDWLSGSEPLDELEDEELEEFGEEDLEWEDEFEEEPAEPAKGMTDLLQGIRDAAPVTDEHEDEELPEPEFDLERGDEGEFNWLEDIREEPVASAAAEPEEEAESPLIGDTFQWLPDDFSEEAEVEETSEVPDWLADAESLADMLDEEADLDDEDLMWGEEEEQEPEAEAVPDWLQGAAPVGEVEFEEEEAELEEDLMWGDEEEEEAEAEAVPDWLQGAAPVGEVELDEEEAELDEDLMWGDEEEEEAEAGAVPDWLQGAAPVGEVELDEEEAELDEDLMWGDEEEEEAETGAVPDWLQGAAPVGEVELEEEEAELDEDLMWGEEEEAEMPAAVAEGEAFEWDMGEETEDAPSPAADFDWAEEEAEAEAETGETLQWGEEAELEEEAEEEFEWADEIEGAYEAPVLAELDDFIDDTAELEHATAGNAPDWLNAMVPGLDVDFAAHEDDPVDLGYTEEDVLHRQRAAQAARREFGWLLEIVESERGGEEDGETRPEAEPRRRFVFSRPPAWMRGSSGN